MGPGSREDNRGVQQPLWCGGKRSATPRCSRTTTSAARRRSGPRFACPLDEKRCRASLVLLLTRKVYLVIPEGCGEGSQGCAVFRATSGMQNTRRSRPGRGAGNRSAQTHSMAQPRRLVELRGGSPHLCRGANSPYLCQIQGCAEYRDPWLPSWRPSRTPPRGEPLLRQTWKYDAIIPAGSGCLTLRVRSSRLSPPGHPTGS